MTASAICAERSLPRTGAGGAPLGGEAIAERLAACARVLGEQPQLWRSVAFRELRPAWEAALPGLAAALRALTLAQAEALHADARAAHAWLARWLPLQDLAAAERVGAWPTLTLRAWPRGFDAAVPGRKWRQIEAFLGAVPPAVGHGLDWCAGKGHLARAACWQWQASGIDALERDAALVAAGGVLARRAALPVALHAVDVLDEEALGWLQPGRHALALHACGMLHRRLLEAGAAARVAALSCAPCCYHLMPPDAALVLSRAGAGQAPPLALADLRTAVQETVTAPGHARRHRQRVQQWQLGFDLLQRELRGLDEYLPLPPQAAAVLRRSFAAYCREVAASKALRLPAATDFARYERAGEERFRHVTALDLVRHRFRRVLELWLVLDRAQYLLEAGYRVGVGTFCARELSPRNLLIDARLA